MNTREMTEIIEDMGYNPVVRAHFKREYGGEVDEIEIRGCGGNLVPILYPRCYTDCEPSEFRKIVEYAVNNSDNIDLDTLNNIAKVARVGVLPSGDYPFCHKPTMYEGIDSFIYVPFDGANVKVVDSLLEHNNITYDELYKSAILNTINDMCEIPLADFMYVVATPDFVYGAGLMLATSVLNNICDKMGVDKIIVIPSSIGEFIALNYTAIPDFDMGGINDLVGFVNAEKLLEHEVLSSKAYIYTKGKGVEICE